MKDTGENGSNQTSTDSQELGSEMAFGHFVSRTESGTRVIHVNEEEFFELARYESPFGDLTVRCGEQEVFVSL